jgi:hypothetical protein
MNTITEFAFAGRDNAIDIQLREDGLPQDISGLTRATLNLQDLANPDDALVLIDSSLHPGIFDWLTRGAEGILQINGGTLADVLAKATNYNARLTIYDATLTNGLVWTHEATTGCTGTRLIIRVELAVDGIAA